ncbi:hypothetical protein [Marinomonas atlantica]|uniref:hypothetical protein n=1 Tax=Marinomonas atlantica TaxID=1806668 RepID=UPI000835BA80|nr:hypothetical protein [Marinomonas atlantica]
MNKHLNIFTTYAKENRTYQLENDLTRSLAICLQEDALFCHEILKTILTPVIFDQIFEDFEGESNVQIEIQKKSSQISEFDKAYAVSISEYEMSDFWSQTDNTDYDPICDLVVTVNNILIVFETKRDNIDCTQQLYNQIFNIFKNQNRDISDCRNEIESFDLNWKKLMAIAVKVASFEKTVGNNNRFLNDFIGLVRDHNYNWLPETPIGSLRNVNSKSIYSRIESALSEFCNNDPVVSKLTYNDRSGTDFTKGWANELLFYIDENKGDLCVEIYPGNTKSQGYYIFHKEPKFNKELTIGNKNYPVTIGYHIKFMGQQYITGLWLRDEDFNKNLFTRDNFYNQTGRVYREDWPLTEKLLDEYINSDWKSECNWSEKIIKSNRSLFNISFGYNVSITIPFIDLAKIDVNKNDISSLAKLIGSIYRAFETELIVE